MGIQSWVVIVAAAVLCTLSACDSKCARMCQDSCLRGTASLDPQSQRACRAECEKSMCR